MIEHGLIAPATVDAIPFVALQDLRFALLEAGTGAPHRWNEGWRTPHDVVSGFVCQGVLADGVSIEPSSSIEDAVHSLREQGIPLGDGWRLPEAREATWASQRYCAGPGMAAFFFGREENVGSSLAVSLLEFDDEPLVVVGGGTTAPFLPGTEDKPLDELPPYDTFMDFIGAAYEDLDTVWHNPDDGHEYRVMELDWSKGFGIARRALMLEGVEINYEGLAEEIGKLVGAPMIDVHKHL